MFSRTKCIFFAICPEISGFPGRIGISDLYHVHKACKELTFLRCWSRYRDNCKKNRKKFADSQNITTFAIPNESGHHFPPQKRERVGLKGLIRGRDRAGYLHQQIRKGEKVATSPTRGTGGGNILRYGVMVALQILALSVRVRVLLSQQRQT